MWVEGYTVLECTFQAVEFKNVSRVIYVNACVWQQPHTSSINHVDDIFTVQVSFRMITFIVLLDEDRPLQKSDTRTDVNRYEKKSCCLNSNQFIVWPMRARCKYDVNKRSVFCHSVSLPYFFVIRYHYHTFPLSLIKSERELCSNVQFSHDIHKNCFLLQWHASLLHCVNWTGDN
jgi:hypothetical protein